MRLIIVESPTKSKTIEKFLDEKYKVLSCYGHIRDLPKGKLSIEIENDFKPQYVIPTKSKKIVTQLKKAVEKADQVILSTDEDREGEAIAWHLTKALNLNEEKEYQRIVFHEITKEAVKKALENPRKINIALVNAQQARRVLDRIVGYKLSPFLWKKIARGLSAGRVQSVAVRLVAEREAEIEKFIAKEYWTIEGLFKAKEKNQLKALLFKKNDKTISKLEIENKKQADLILKELKDEDYKISKIEKKETKKNPLPPFTTSSLQQTAWQKFKWTAKQTMRISQQLYETGRITYHRTDSLNLSESSLIGAKNFIVENYGENYWPGFVKKYKTKIKGAQEAHEAIRPTNPEDSPQKIKLDERQTKLYQLIWQRFIASQMSQAIFDSVAIEIESQKNKDSKYSFKALGQTLKFEGFLKVYPMKYEESELPELNETQELEVVEITPFQHFTQPPARYNEGTLIKALEENKIGRPSTYAPILSNIQDKNYIEKDDQKRFRPTEIGLAVNNILTAHFPQIVNINFTAEMEKNLDEIAENKREWTSLIKEFYWPFEQNLINKYQEVSKKDITEKPTDKKCPKCKSPLLIRLGKYGKFYACSEFPKCRHTQSLEENQLKINCPKCNKGKLVEKRTKRRKIFYGCDNYPKCDFALWDKPTKENCPKCKSILTESKKDKLKCSNKDCQYAE